MRLVAWSAFVAVASGAMAADVVDVPFFDTAGNRYRTSSLATDLASRYGHKFEGARVLLVETRSLASAEYEAQSKAVDSLGHGEIEQFRILLVVACPSGEYKHGYHISPDVAQMLVSGETRFRVRLLSPAGVVQKEAFHPLLVEELRRWLSEAQ